jgi:1,4-alpha-glucan branching enzyme
MPGEWREVFHSDAYENWVNAAAMGNRGHVMADPQPLHGFAYPACVVLPAHSLIVFAAHQVTYSPSIDLGLPARLSE